MSLPVNYAPLYRGFGLDERKYRTVFGPRTVRAIILSALVNGANYQSFEKGLPFSFTYLYTVYPEAVESCVRCGWLRAVLEEVAQVIELKNTGFNEDVEDEISTFGWEIKRIVRNLDSEVYAKVSKILHPEIPRKPVRKETELMLEKQYMRLW